jgi:glycosyltransferase involved in cell wall biosynthesis
MGRQSKGKKVIIQLPCYNEAESLPVTLQGLPRSLAAIDKVEWLICDDGSIDDTADVAARHGVDHVVRLSGHQGLARAFTAALRASVEAGADIIINIDADNQYCADDIPTLIEPILRDEADIVIGARSIEKIAHFSLIKKLLQRLGSAAVRIASGTDVRDAPCGFRSYSREAAMRTRVFNNYTYTLETIIQAGQCGMRVLSVPVRTNPDLRPSRLIKSIWNYVSRSLVTILLIFVIYRPLQLFVPLASMFAVGGVLLALRYLYFIAIGAGAGHVQSVVASGLLITIAVIVLLIGVIAHLISANRRLLEDLDWKVQHLSNEVSSMTPGSKYEGQTADDRGILKQTTETKDIRPSDARS